MIIIIGAIALLLFAFLWIGYKPQATDVLYKLIGKKWNANEGVYKIKIKKHEYTFRLLLDNNDFIRAICADEKEKMIPSEIEFYKKENKDLLNEIGESKICDRIIKCAFSITKTKKLASYFLEDSNHDFYFYIEDNNYEKPINRLLKSKYS